MKVKKVQAFALAYPEPHYKGIERYLTLARVEADDGRVGWGECISQLPEASLATKTIIEQGFAPLLVGDDALDVERLWHKMLSRIWWYGPEGIAAFAVSAVDMALWDLKGKILACRSANCWEVHSKTRSSRWVPSSSTWKTSIGRSTSSAGCESKATVW